MLDPGSPKPPAIARGHRLVTLHLKKGDHRFARIFIVFDDEDFGILPLFVAVHKTIVQDSGSRQYSCGV